MLWFLVFGLIGAWAFWLLASTAWEVVGNAWDAHNDAGFSDGIQAGREQVRDAAEFHGFAAHDGDSSEDPSGFRWKTRDEIADEVLAERAVKGAK